MTDGVAAHEMTDVAALYALGALSQHEARSFEEHLAEGCDICQAELESFEQTVRAVAFGIAEAEPPARVRAELLAKVSKSVPEQTGESVPTGGLGQFVSILASEGKWLELREGVLLKKLHVDQATGIATSLVRMLPGTALPCHQHLGVEQFFVIEGDCNVAGQRLTSGDYHRAEAGSIHETTYTVDGTLFLLIAPERYEVLDAR
jgi:quercetin dioxygenase-like cupin family protein